MPLTYKIIKSKRTVYVVGDRVVTFWELMQHIDLLSRDKDYKAPMKKCID